MKSSLLITLIAAALVAGITLVRAEPVHPDHPSTPANDPWAGLRVTTTTPKEDRHLIVLPDSAPIPTPRPDKEDNK